jgi:hypothetical protein
MGRIQDSGFGNGNVIFTSPILVEIAAPGLLQHSVVFTVIPGAWRTKRL